MRRVQYIPENDGTEAEICAYKKSKFRYILLHVGYLLSAFILRLVVFWRKHLFYKLSCEKCSLLEANYVIVKDVNGIYYSEEVYLTKNHFTIENCSTNRFFIYKKLKYYFDNTFNEFKLLPTYDECNVGRLRHCSPLPDETVDEYQQLYSKNIVDVPLDSYFHLLVHQALNPFYIFQLASCILWYFDEYYIYATCILLMAWASVLWEVIESRKNQLALHKTVCLSSEIQVIRSHGGKEEYIASIPTSELVPGDIIKIPPQGCSLFCDALLLTGNCIVNESSLTGESVPITKVPYLFKGGAPYVTKTKPQEKDLSQIQKLDLEEFDIDASARCILYSGTKVIQTRNYANEDVLALTLRTGFRTERGDLVRSIIFPKPIKFKFDNDAYRFVGCLSIIAVIGFIYTVVVMSKIRADADTHDIIFKALDLITIVVPPALPLAMTVGILFAQNRFKEQNIFCIKPSVINLTGVINCCCFDKTGTLTEEGLDLWGVIPNNETSGTFQPPCKDPSELKDGPLIETLAACHSITRISGELSGDPLDLKMFISTNWELIEETNEDNQKFEMTVPVIVRPKNANYVEGAKIFGSTESIGSINDNEPLPYEVGILRQFPFSSSLQRMSVISRVLNKTHFSVFTKGSPEMLENMCRKDTIPSNYHEVLLEYTKEGYRVLALAWRPLKTSYSKIMKMPRDVVEKKLRFLGLLIMENRLKPETAPVICELKSANIRTVMVTGDNMLTALSVARDSEIIDEYDKVIIVNAFPPPDNTQPGDENQKSWEHLVEFHYAEDLQRPVLEVTTTTEQRRRKSRLPNNEESSRGDFGSTFAKRNSKMQRLLANLKTSKLFSKKIKEPVYMDGNGNPQNGSPTGDSGAETPRLFIRMLDRPNFHLAISGKTWAIIKEHFPWLIPKLVVKGTVFARFSPDQKSQLIEALQSVGYYVSMCGDGANDCGALKAAHAGISLSEAEASVASHFTSRKQDISCVPIVIKEGRCALVTSFGTFKFMCGYSIVEFFSCVILYSMASSLGDVEFLYIDLIVITSLGLSFGYTRPSKKLSVEPPPMRLVSMVTLLSLGLQLLICVLTQLFAFFYVQSRDWYSNILEIDFQEYKYKNFENTGVFLASSFQYIYLAIVFSKGAPYRKNMFTNRLFIANIALVLGMSLYLSVWPSQFFLDLFELVRFPDFKSKVTILLIVLGSFLLGLLIDLFVDGMSFRRRIRKLRKSLFHRYIQPKDYEKINDEIEKMAASWPPIIRSASVQDIRFNLITSDLISEKKKTRNALSVTENEDSDSDNPEQVSNKIYTNRAYEVNVCDNPSKETEPTIFKPKLRRTKSLNPEDVTLGNTMETNRSSGEIPPTLADKKMDRLIIGKRTKFHSSSKEWFPSSLPHQTPNFEVNIDFLQTDTSTKM